MKIFTEGVFTSLAKMFGKFRREIRKAEKLVEDDPNLKTELENLAQQNRDAHENLKAFCKRYPDDPICGLLTGDLSGSKLIAVDGKAPWRRKKR